MTALQLRLRSLRDESGMTVRDLAEKLNKTPGYVSRIEARGEVPSPELLWQLAKVYDVAPDELFELAKKSQIARAASEIDAKYASALTLFRKANK